MDPVNALSVLLSRERLLLELLVFKLTELNSLLAAGEPRFLGWATEEVERAVQAVQAVELERAGSIQALIATLPQLDGADESQVLELLAESTGGSIPLTLREHRTALVTLAAEVRAGLDQARRLADAGSAAVTDLLERAGALAAPPPALLTYGPGSTTAWSAPAPRLRTSL